MMITATMLSTEPKMEALATLPMQVWKWLHWRATSGLTFMMRLRVCPAKIPLVSGISAP